MFKFDKKNINNYIQSNFNNNFINKIKKTIIPFSEINQLQKLIAKASIGNSFLLQINDFEKNCNEYTVYKRFNFINLLAEFFYKKTSYKATQVCQYKNKAFSNNEIFLNSYHQKLTYQKKMLEQKIYSSRSFSSLYNEQKTTEFDYETGLFYNIETHFLCLEKHDIKNIKCINYLKKLANPIAIKVGPKTCINHLIKTIDQLDPNHIPGRITLIPSLGAHNVHYILPQLIDSVNNTDRNVLWSCDPISGNGAFPKLNNIIDEIKNSFLIYKELNSTLNAIYIAATHKNVIECINYNLDFNSSAFEICINNNKNSNFRLNYEQTWHVLQQITRYYIECLNYNT